MNFTTQHATPVKSIRAFCRQCMGYYPSEVKKCNTFNCPLYPYKDGKKPKNSQLIGLTKAIELSKREREAQK